MEFNMNIRNFDTLEIKKVNAYNYGFSNDNETIGASISGRANKLPSLLGPYRFNIKSSIEPNFKIVSLSLDDSHLVVRLREVQFKSVYEEVILSFDLDNVSSITNDMDGSIFTRDSILIFWNTLYRTNQVSLEITRAYN